MLSDKVIIGGMEFNGDKLNIHMVYPNPLNSNKYIVIISTNNFQYFNFGNIDLSTTGWYDFGVWNIQDNKFILKYAGYFDPCWN